MREAMSRAGYLRTHPANAAIPHEMRDERSNEPGGKDFEDMKQLFHKYMIRPTIYKATFKLSIGAVICLLWDRFLNREKIYTIWEAPCLLCGCIFLAGAWFCYLKLDGVSVHHLMEGWQKKRPKKKHTTKSMVDFVDEKVISFEDLEPEERTVCNLLSDLILGILFLIPAIISGLL